MLRLLFEKKGDAIWISHLDLMRLFQRAFKRAGLPLVHTQGFNPRPSVSIALPLSVGVESCCELLDFELDGVNTSMEEICQKLNTALIPDVRVLKVYDDGRKLRDLALLSCRLTMAYDHGIPDGAEAGITELLSRETLIVDKRSKNGMQQQDIIPMIHRFSVSSADEKTVIIDALVCCQNPSLNPMQLFAAIERYSAQWSPDFASCCRLEIFDTNEEIFR